MPDFFKREYVFNGSDFEDGSLVPIKEEEPWEYMFDGPCPRTEKPLTFEEREKQRAEYLIKNKAIVLMIDEHIKKCFEILRGRNNEGESRS